MKKTLDAESIPVLRLPRGIRFGVLAALLVLPAAAACDEPAAQESNEEEVVAAPEHAGHAGHGEGEMAPMPTLEDGARVSFVSPTDGAELSGPLVDGKVEVAIQMGAENVRIAPAGQVEAGAGHHHIIIDADGTPEGEAVPADDTHIHFGGGQTETTLGLAPGEHTLRLQLADGLHRSYGPNLSTTITITVTAAE